MSVVSHLVAGNLLHLVADGLAVVVEDAAFVG